MRFLSLLGIAQGAGRLVSGDIATYEALERGKVRLLVFAVDVAPRTQRKFTELAQRLNVPYVQVASKAALGKAIGKPDRAVVGVIDRGFARSLQAALVSSGNLV